MAMAFRNMLRTAARRMQVRGYADAPRGDEMALTFAAGNKVRNFFNYSSTNWLIFKIFYVYQVNVPYLVIFMVVSFRFAGVKNIYILICLLGIQILA